MFVLIEFCRSNVIVGLQARACIFCNSNISAIFSIQKICGEVPSYMPAGIMVVIICPPDLNRVNLSAKKIEGTFLNYIFGTF